MMSLRQDRLLRAMGCAARQAGLAIVGLQDRRRGSRYKKDQSLLTRADLLAEQIIWQRLRRADPACPILSEEKAPQPRSRSRQFIVDPIDGTSNYASGFPWYCVSIAREEEGVLTHAAVYIPERRELLLAKRGRGAFCNGQRLRVSQTARLKDALMGVGFYYHRDHLLDEEAERFKNVHRICRGVRRPGSAVLDLIAVARGWYDGFWERGLNPWDLAAGRLLVEEAGGTITDYEGRPHSLYGETTAASNGLIHREFLRAIRL